MDHAGVARPRSTRPPRVQRRPRVFSRRNAASATRSDTAAVGARERRAFRGGALWLPRGRRERHFRRVNRTELRWLQRTQEEPSAGRLSRTCSSLQAGSRMRRASSDSRKRACCATPSSRCSARMERRSRRCCNPSGSAMPTVSSSSAVPRSTTQPKERRPRARCAKSIARYSFSPRRAKRSYVPDGVGASGGDLPDRRRRRRLPRRSRALRAEGSGIDDAARRQGRR